MAGHARRNAALTELEVRAHRAGLSPLEWVEEQLANGKTMVKMAEEFTSATGIEITRNILDKICKGLEPDAGVRLAEAQEAGAHALVERQHERLEKLGKNSLGEETMFINKEEIALENLRTRNVQWIAERKNRKDFGASPLVNINQSLGALHLDVLRRLSAQDARELQAAPKQLVEGVDYEIEPSAESLM